VYAALLMAASLLLGRELLQIVGVSPPAVLGAGGIVVMGLGFRMLITGKTSLPNGGTHVPDQAATRDHGLVPLAFPGVCGPGARGVLTSGSSYIQNLGSAGRAMIGYGVALAGIATVCILAYLILLLSRRIATWLGPGGLDGMCRFLGMLLIVIGVQLMADGVS